MESPIDLKPELGTGEVYYYNDFVILGSERQTGSSVGAIPILKITKYAEVEGIHDVELFKTVMLKLDAVYLRLMAAERKKQEAKQKAKKAK